MSLIGGQIALTEPSTFTTGLKMNERIRDLALDAIVENIAAEGWVFSDQELQQFADAIVREAIAVVQKRYMGDQNREDMEVRRCVEDLRKHFGVEE
jgi:hypothetical protein